MRRNVHDGGFLVGPQQDADHLNAIVFKNQAKMGGIERGGMGIKNVGREALVLS
jgi:hypothetical protein